jgi:tetratricopeptide (TPR) repeat protein
LGNALFQVGRAEESLDAFARCAEISVHGADCYGMKGYAEMLLGRCADSEKDYRRAADRNPFYETYLGWSSAASSPSPSAFDAFVAHGAKASTFFSPAGQAVVVALAQAGRAILFGDFARAGSVARKALADLEADPKSRSIYFMHYGASATLLDVALETGDVVTARRIATDFVARRAEWAQDDARARVVAPRRARADAQARRAVS